MREMKDSGVEWIGKIPKDWEIVPLTKQLDSIVDYRGKTPEKTEEGTFLVTAKNIKDGKICYELSKEYVREADYEEIMHRGIPQIGDILFTTEAPLGQVANVDRTDIALAQRIIKFRALSTVNNYYLKYWMLNEGFQQFLHSLSTGSTATGIKSSKLFLLPLVRPNIEQQNKIVEYLDAKCSKIDEIVEKQKVIIEKLEEYKLSIITEAVTSGINPDVEMKDSGSVWFGNIPINWEMKRLKYVFHIQKDIAGEEGHTVLSITQRGIIPKDFSNNEGQFANSYANYQLVHKGDFAMNHMDLLTGWVDISKYEGVTSPDYRVFVLNDKNGMCPKYYLYMMQMCYSARIFYGLGQGVSGMGRWRLQADKKDPLTVIIDKINEKYGTHFTEMDKVLVQMENDYANQEKWQSYAKNNDRATFMLLFEKDFPNMAADRYEQNDQFFRKLFDDPDMMRQVMETVGSVLYERLKKKYIFDPKSGVIEEATPETYVEDTYLTKK
ncbi:restriction endonuclease subunit S [Clostridioides difficile]|nr:restriction endonuclease subunit S [Clostridioides difficile]